MKGLQGIQQWHLLRGCDRQGAVLFDDITESSRHENEAGRQTSLVRMLGSQVLDVGGKGDYKRQ